MPDSFEDQEWVKMGVATALMKEYEGDQRPFLQLLADTFEKLLPGEAEITTQGWFKNKKVVGLGVKLGEFQYTIQDPGKGPLVASKKKIVRGIALKTEPIPLQQCLSEIGDELERRAQTSADARKALVKML